MGTGCDPTTLTALQCFGALLCCMKTEMHFKVAFLCFSGISMPGAGYVGAVFLSARTHGMILMSRRAVKSHGFVGSRGVFPLPPSPQSWEVTAVSPTSCWVWEPSVLCHCGLSWDGDSKGGEGEGNRER